MRAFRGVAGGLASPFLAWPGTPEFWRGTDALAFGLTSAGAGNADVEALKRAILGGAPPPSRRSGFLGPARRTAAASAETPKCPNFGRRRYTRCSKERSHNYNLLLPKYFPCFGVCGSAFGYVQPRACGVMVKISNVCSALASGGSEVNVPMRGMWIAIKVHCEGTGRLQVELARATCVVTV